MSFPVCKYQNYERQTNIICFFFFFLHSFFQEPNMTEVVEEYEEYEEEEEEIIEEVSGHLSACICKD